MCGIAGLFPRQPLPSAVSVLEAMAGTLAHRGPDDEGFLLYNDDAGPFTAHAFAGDGTQQGWLAATGTAHIRSAEGRRWRGGLAHRRLSIFDLSPAGHQPMRRGNLSIVFNGAIYNFPELRAELQAEGQHFTTNTDTEVLLAAYQAWGDRMVLKLEGMWAFVIVDEAAGTLIISRDRLGVKPLYFLQHAEGFAFASEQKALYKVPFLERRLSRGAAFDYLVLGNHEGRAESLIKAIEEVRPGTITTYTLAAEASKVWEYYQPVPNLKWERFRPTSNTRYRDKIKELLTDAVRLRLRADVPLGACLSGGLDSSTLVCLAALLGQAEQEAGRTPVGLGIDTFTACYPGQQFDEAAQAEATAKYAGARWHAVLPDAQGLEADLADFVYTHDLPLQTPATYGQYAVMRAASQAGVRVTFDGQGADELFGGYAHHYQAFLPQLFENGEWTRAILSLTRSQSNFASRGRFLRGLIKKMSVPTGFEKMVERSFRTRHLEYGYIRTSLWDAHRKLVRRHIFDTPTGLNEALAMDMAGPMMHTHLRLADRNSMRFGIESRVPFADSTALMAYVLQVPSVYKIRHNKGKALLRAVVRGLVPPAVLAKRDKLGFAGPEQAWLEHLSPILREAVRTPGMEEFIHVNKIYAAWPSLVRHAARSGGALRLWRMAAMGLWLQDLARR